MNWPAAGIIFKPDFEKFFKKILTLFIIHAILSFVSTHWLV
jgi:hypothetical protein